MTRIDTDHELDADGAEAILAARRDLLVEEEVGPGRFTQQAGPFQFYERTAQISDRTTNGTTTVRETIDFRLDIPFWRPIVTPLMKRALADSDRTPRSRWWWPEEVVSRRSAVLVSIIAVLSIMAGYLGVVISQTITFAAEEFGASDGDQANTLAAMRVGVLLSLVLIRYADRIGRRPLLIGFATGSVLFTALGAFSPNLIVLGGTQAIARGLDTGLFTLVGLAASEEVPAKIRAVVLGVMTMCAGLGAGMVVWVLPVADLSTRAWRLVYIVPLIFLPLLLWCWRRMPETRRFDVAAESHSPDGIRWSRFALLGVGAFASAMFLSPASQLQNEYLRDEQGFTATNISVFRLLIGTPVGIPILLAGALADRRGRKPIGSFGIAVGSLASLAAYFSGGWALWMTSAISVWLLAAAVTVLRSYQTELFPTRARARIGGWLDVIAVSGSVVGLVAVGILADRYGSLGPAMSVVIWGPLLAAGLIYFAYPETASKELEAFNPTDPALASPSEIAGPVDDAIDNR